MSFMHRFFQGVVFLRQVRLDAPFWDWHNIMERMMHLHETEADLVSP